jgi:hypothetical protein
MNPRLTPDGHAVDIYLAAIYDAVREALRTNEALPGATVTGRLNLASFHIDIERNKATVEVKVALRSTLPTSPSSRAKLDVGRPYTDGVQGVSRLHATSIKLENIAVRAAEVAEVVARALHNGEAEQARFQARLAKDAHVAALGVEVVALLEVEPDRVWVRRDVRTDLIELHLHDLTEDEVRAAAIAVAATRFARTGNLPSVGSV